MNMQELSDKFWKDHRGSGRVTSVTNYSFTWETLPDKDGKVKATVYMLSYFLALK